MYTTLGNEKKEKNQFLRYFWSDLLKAEENVLEIHKQCVLSKTRTHTNSEDISEIKLPLLPSAQN